MLMVKISSLPLRLPLQWQCALRITGLHYCTWLWLTLVGSTGSCVSGWRAVVKVCWKCFIKADQSGDALRLRNDLYCVGWGVKLYSLTHSLVMQVENSCNLMRSTFYTCLCHKLHLYIVMSSPQLQQNINPSHEASKTALYQGCVQGWVFAMAKSIFARTVEKTVKNHGNNRQKPE